MAIGEYDFTFFGVPYPSLNPNTTEGVFFSQHTRDILTAIRERVIKSDIPDYFVYSKNVYWLMLVFLFIWCILNVVSNSIRKRRKRSTCFLLKELLNSMFHFITAHLNAVTDRPISRVLQLTLISSVTLLLSAYSACFSNDSIKIYRPKVYDSFESLKKDPPDIIALGQMDIDQLDQGGFWPSSPENQLKDIRKHIYHHMELPQVGQETEIVSVTMLGDLGVRMFKMLLFGRARSRKISIIKRTDPRAEFVFTHATISKSVLNKLTGEKLIWTFQSISEHGMYNALLCHIASLTLDISPDNPFAQTIKFLIISEPPQEKKVLPPVQMVSICSFRPLFSAFAFFLIMASVALAFESAFNKWIVKNGRQNRVRRQFDSGWILCRNSVHPLTQS